MAPPGVIAGTSFDVDVSLPPAEEVPLPTQVGKPSPVTRMRVVVPEGVQPGQAIVIQAPGTVKTVINAIVPPGVIAGMSFEVDVLLPPAEAAGATNPTEEPARPSAMQQQGANAAHAMRMKRQETGALDDDGVVRDTVRPSAKLANGVGIVGVVFLAVGLLLMMSAPAQQTEQEILECKASARVTCLECINDREASRLAVDDCYIDIRGDLAYCVADRCIFEANINDCFTDCEEVYEDDLKRFEMTCGAGALYAVGALCIICYWIECFCASKTMKYLSNIMDQKEFSAYIVSLQSANPACRFSIQNYHMETRTRTTTDSDGNSKTETYQARVNTHFAATQYPILGHTDETLAPTQMIALFHLIASGAHGDLEHGEAANRLPKESEKPKVMVLLCKFPIEFLPRDTETESDYPVFRDRFYQANTTDSRQDKNEVHQLEGAQLKERVMCVLTSDDTGKHSALPFYMNKTYFVLASLLCMSVPYRKYMYSQTRKSTWRVTKHFSRKEPTTWTAGPIKSLHFSTDASLAAVMKGEQRPTSTLRSPIPMANNNVEEPNPNLTYEVDLRAEA